MIPVVPGKIKPTMCGTDAAGELNIARCQQLIRHGQTQLGVFRQNLAKRVSAKSRSERIWRDDSIVNSRLGKRARPFHKFATEYVGVRPHTRLRETLHMTLKRCP